MCGGSCGQAQTVVHLVVVSLYYAQFWVSPVLWTMAAVRVVECDVVHVHKVLQFPIGREARKGLHDCNSPMCTLSQNGYGDSGTSHFMDLPMSSPGWAGGWVV